MVDKIINQAIKTSDRETLLYIKEKVHNALTDTVAHVRSASKLTESQMELLRKEIRSKFPEASEVVFEQVDELLGGVEIVYQDYRYDGSLRGTFEELKTKVYG